MSEEPDTAPETPLAIQASQAPRASWLARRRGLIVDGAIVAGLAVAVWQEAMTAEVAAPIIAAVLLSHAKPQGTSAETAAKALVGVLPKLLGRRAP